MPEIIPFLPDIFSNDEAIFSELDVKKSDKISSIFITVYKHLKAKVVTVKKFGGFEINSNNFLIETNNGTYLLKLFDQLDDFKLNALEKQFALMAWLFKQKVPCPFPIRGSEKAYICAVESGEWVSLMTFVLGSYFPERETCDSRKMGETVGKFHAQLRTAPDRLKPNRQYPLLSSLDHEMFGAVLSGSNNILLSFPEEYRNILIENKNFLDKIWNKVLTYNDQFVESEQSLTHIDIHPHNVIVRGGELVAFLDFDSLMHAPLKMMLGFSAYKLLRKVISRQKTKLPQSEICDLVDGYLEGVYEYLPEIRSEKSVIALFTFTEICRRIAYIFRLNIQDNNPEWNHVLAIQISGLKEVEILFERSD